MPKVVVPMEEKIDAIAKLITDEPMNIDQIHAKLPLFSRSTIYRLCRDYPGFVNVNYPMTPKRYQYDPTIDISSWLYADRIKVITHRETVLGQRIETNSLKTINVEDSPLKLDTFAYALAKILAVTLPPLVAELTEFSDACRAYVNGESSVIPARPELDRLTEFAHILAYRVNQLNAVLTHDDYYLRITE